MKVLVSQSREVSLVDSYKFLGVKQTGCEEIKRKEGMVRKLKALTSNMLKLANRKKRWTARWEMVNLVGADSPV